MRLKFAVAPLAAVLIAVVGVTLASASPSPRVITLFEKTVQGQFINEGPQAVSQGDHFVFASDLSHTKGGPVVGDDGGVCTVVRGKTAQLATFQCVVTARFAGGEITLQGLIDENPTATPPPPPFDTAITGGSGAFEGANGHVNVHQLNQTDSILTFHLR